MARRPSSIALKAAKMASTRQGLWLQTGWEIFTAQRPTVVRRIRFAARMGAGPYFAGHRSRHTPSDIGPARGGKTMNRTMSKLLLASVCALAFATAALAADEFTVVHTFKGGSVDGDNPHSALTPDGLG